MFSEINFISFGEQSYFRKRDQRKYLKERSDGNMVNYNEIFHIILKTCGKYVGEKKIILQIKNRHRYIP